MFFGLSLNKKRRRGIFFEFPRFLFYFPVLTGNIFLKKICIYFVSCLTKKENLL